MNTTTTTTKRVTKAQRFADIKAILSGEPITYGTTIDEAMGFIDNEISLLAKKNSGEHKMTSTQAQNEVFKELIINYMCGSHIDPNGVTCSDINKGIPELTEFNNQKISSLMRQLKSAGRVKDHKVKGKTLFVLA